MGGAVIGAVGTVLAAIFTILVGYFVKRTDSAAKMTRQNMQDQSYVMQLVGSIRDDYWTLSSAHYHLRDIAARWRRRLIDLGQEVEELPAMPTPKHQALEARHDRGEDTTRDEG